MVQALVSTALQLAVVLAVALACWAASGRKRAFRDYTGLIASPWGPVLVGAALGVAGALLLIFVPATRELAQGEGSAAAQLRQAFSGAAFWAALLVTAVIKTAFTEELLFRGVIGKIAIRTLGFPIGNFIQAMSFGAVHLILFLIPTSTAASVWAMVAFTFAMGWFNGWLNEKKAGGSILPGWAAHACANTVAYALLA